MQFLKHKNGMKISHMVEGIIGILVLAILFVNLVPSIKTTITASAGNWTAGEYALLGIVGILLVVAFIYAIYKMTMGSDK